METFVSHLVASNETRWNEVDRLLLAAEDLNGSDELLRDAMCRSVVVLIAANLEGFVRDIAKAITSDLNRFGNFRGLPSSLKRTFCRTFIPEEGKEPNERTEKLIAHFDSLETQLTWESFLATSRFDGQKNASPSVIERVATNFGINKIFHRLAESDLDSVFSESSTQHGELLLKMREHLTVGTKQFPYEVDLSIFGLNSPSPPPRNTRTLWEAFIDDFLRKRHRIAHGSVSDNHDSIDELMIERQKMAVLQLGILFLICDAVIR